MSGDALEVVGVVLDEHRGGLYRVDCTATPVKRVVLARLAGRLVKNHIRVIAFDVVTVEVSPYDTGRGRITYRGRRERSAT